MRSRFATIFLIGSVICFQSCRQDPPRDFFIGVHQGAYVRQVDTLISGGYGNQTWLADFNRDGAPDIELEYVFGHSLGAGNSYHLSVSPLHPDVYIASVVERWYYSSVTDSSYVPSIYFPPPAKDTIVRVLSRYTRDTAGRKVTQVRDFAFAKQVDSGYFLAHETGWLGQTNELYNRFSYQSGGYIDSTTVLNYYYDLNYGALSKPKTYLAFKYKDKRVYRFAWILFEQRVSGIQIIEYATQE